jgi:hypothetical protein
MADELCRQQVTIPEATGDLMCVNVGDEYVNVAVLALVVLDWMASEAGRFPEMKGAAPYLKEARDAEFRRFSASIEFLKE